MASPLAGMALRIDPETYYDEWRLRMAGLDGEALEVGRRSGQLRCRDLPGGRVYKGAWLIAWLDGAETGKEAVA